MKLSHFYKTKNKNRYKTANDDYYLCATRGTNKKIVNYLFTENDLKKAHDRADKNKEDVPPEEFFSAPSTAWVSLLYFTVGFVTGILSGVMYRIVNESIFSNF